MPSIFKTHFFVHSCYFCTKLLRKTLSKKKRLQAGETTQTSSFAGKTSMLYKVEKRPVLKGMFGFLFF